MATSGVPQTTDFTRDVLGRFICNGMSEYFLDAKAWIRCSSDREA